MTTTTAIQPVKQPAYGFNTAINRGNVFAASRAAASIVLFPHPGALKILFPTTFGVNQRFVKTVPQLMQITIMQETQPGKHLSIGEY